MKRTTVPSPGDLADDIRASRSAATQDTFRSAEGHAREAFAALELPVTLRNASAVPRRAYADPAPDFHQMIRAARNGDTSIDTPDARAAEHGWVPAPPDMAAEIRSLRGAAR